MGKNKDDTAKVLSEGWYRVLLDKSPDLLLLVADARILYANDQFCRVLGYAAGELCADSFPFSSLLDQDCAEQAGKALALRLKNVPVKPFECGFIKRDGNRVQTVLSLSLVENGGEKAVLAAAVDITEIHTAWEKTQRMAELYRSLIESTDTGYVIIDTFGTVLDANQEYVRLSGRRSLGDILGRKVTDWTSPADLERNAKAVEECARQGFIRNLELSYVKPDGGETAVEINASVMDMHGFQRILSICRDISARKEIEKSLLKSEEKFRAVIEQNTEGIALLDERGNLIEWNRALETITGISRAEAMGRPLWEVQTGLDGNPAEKTASIDRIKATVLNTLRTGDAPLFGKPIEAVIKGRNGLRQIQQTIFRIRTETSVSLGSIVRDVTEQKRSEKALKESEDMFRRLIEGAPEGIYVQSEGVIVYANSAALALFGARTESELIGTPLPDRIHPDFRGVISKRVHRIKVEGKANPPLEEIYLRLDGKPVPVEVSAVPVLFQNRHGALIFARDITEKRKSEEALSNAQKLESIGILAGGIAHDFNNLLSGLFGYLELAHGSLSAGVVSEAMSCLSNALLVFDRARALTRQLLTFSKGGQPMRKAIRPESLVGECVTFALSGSSLRCSTEFEPGIRLCDIDENQIGQVIDNILINAQQAMPGGGEIRIMGSNVVIGEDMPGSILKPGLYVKISFTDTGIGIPRDILPRIFDPFFTTKQKGSGLGLSIAYSIVKRHEGTIEVESEPGKGTTFHLFLPASDKAAPETSIPVQAEFADGAGILVMDDEKSVRDVTARMLEKAGYRVSKAVDGDEAIAIVRKKMGTKDHIVLAILDLTVPGGRGGKETVGELHALDPAVKTVVSSGYSEDPIMAHPVEYGFSGCLGKPYRFDEIANLVASLLNDVLHT